MTWFDGARFFVHSAIVAGFSSFLCLRIATGAESTSYGENAYQANCASCHGPSLGGRFAPALTGEKFRNKWAVAPGSLLGYIKGAMPPGAAGSLTDEAYGSIHDVIARENGLPLSPSSQAPSSSSPPPPIISEAQRDARYTDGEEDEVYRTAMRDRSALLGKMSPVTDAVLKDPPARNWPMWRRTWDSAGFSPLDQINRSNVDTLTLAWSLTLSQGTNGIAPLVHDDVMFLNASGKVIALDAQSGDVLWKFSGLPVAKRQEPNLVPVSQPRSIALYGEYIYVPTQDGHMLALDMRSGKLVWDHKIFDTGDGLQLTAGPLVARGKIIQGVAGCTGAHAGGCYVVALDAASGQEIWRFHTIARGSQPGADSWNGAPVEKRFGGSVWTTGSYDPDLNLIYFGTGQTYRVLTLLQPNARRGASSDALFTDSTLALDPDNGKLVWYYQHLPGDVWDLDWSFEQSLVTLDGPAGPQRLLVTGGKIAMFDVLDAKAGRFLFSVDLGLQNLVTAVDPRTGRKTINPAAKFDRNRSAFVCPYVGGARSWPATSVDPVAKIVTVPMVEDCMDIGINPESTPDDNWVLLLSHKKRPDSDGKFGRVAAFDLRTRKIRWVNRRRAPQASAVLATAGGLVFEGSSDRRFRALDSNTGEMLWQTALNDTPNGFPITFAVDSVQYVALITGGQTPFDLDHRKLAPEIEPSSGSRTIWVFELGKSDRVSHLDKRSSGERDD